MQGNVPRQTMDHTLRTMGINPWKAIPAHAHDAFHGLHEATIYIVGTDWANWRQEMEIGRVEAMNDLVDVIFIDPDDVLGIDPRDRMLRNAGDEAVGYDY